MYPFRSSASKTKMCHALKKQNNGISKKLRICEPSRASEFLKAVIYLQDYFFCKNCRFRKRKPCIWCRLVVKLGVKLALSYLYLFVLQSYKIVGIYDWKYVMSLMVYLHKPTKFRYFNSSKPGLDEGMRSAVKSRSFIFLENLLHFPGKNWNRHYTTWIWPNSR